MAQLAAEKHAVRTFFRMALKSCLKESERKLFSVMMIQQLAVRGLALHHAGMLPILKEIRQAWASDDYGPQYSYLIRLPSSLTARPPKLYWFIRNGHHSLATSSLHCRKPMPSTFFIAINFPPVSDGSLIQASPFCWSCSIFVFPEFA
ncbi:unnamed protein product [Protopolystoma xenopodis]|uniref:Uncharacterized protein n=1 Tax=Protopolystoma xenopodis TaxID=117903 RepID=A0A3S4ZYM4_9PLAT|nr:unnamed protein product [Protopolystoma xenopodis]